MAEPTAAGPIWSKRVDSSGIDALNISYCAGRDVRARPPADRALIESDLATNAAHAIMLGDTGIISADERKALLAALVEARRVHLDGGDLLRPEAEDIHMSIELFVTERAGAGMGGRLHTGRSRNDQVATDMRLWQRGVVAQLTEEVLELADALKAHAQQHLEHPCPGWTHMQPGMVSTWGHWTAAYLVRAERSLKQLADLMSDFEECPLGGAASYGTSWPINRERTAGLLGFDRPTASSVDPTWSRGEAEGRFAFAATQLLNALSGIGQDLILLSSPPRVWVRLADAFVTGSSIMPQKRNPDFAEVTRARAATLAGMTQSLLGIGRAAAGGYNRDSQWTKYLVMDAADEVLGAPRLFAKVFETLEVHADRMRAACDEGFLNATDVADYLASTRGLPFRACYRVLGLAVKESEAAGRLQRDAINAGLASLEETVEPLSEAEMARFDDPLKLVELRDQPGSPSPTRVRESVEQLLGRSRKTASEIKAQSEGWDSAMASLWAEAERLANS